jgi:hypothetical protein
MNMLSTGPEDFKTIEQIIFKTMCKVACEILREILEKQDEHILNNRDKKKYRCIDKRDGCIKTVVGEVVYTRTYYRTVDRTGHMNYVYLLDEELGIKNGFGQMSELLTESINDMCLDVSFRKAAGAINMLTGQSVSAAGVWNVAKGYGERVVEQETQAVAQNEAGCLIGATETKVLFEEMDGLWLPIQKDKREPNKTKDTTDTVNKRPVKRELKIASAYSGWKETPTGRYETVGKVVCAGFESTEEFTKIREASLSQYYDADGIDVRILNGDGAKWIKASGEDAVMQLDPFHLKRAIMRGAPNTEVRVNINQQLKSKDITGCLAYIDSQADAAEDESIARRLRDLHGYLYENRECLTPWDERGLKLPLPPEGVVYRRLGVQEHTNFDIVGRRMKRRGSSWSVKGASRMAKQLCKRATTDTFGQVDISEGRAAYTPPSSAASTPNYDGKGEAGGTAHGVIPFVSAALTAGRKAIRKIFDLKPLSELRLQ